jgi:hypothetical protein
LLNSPNLGDTFYIVQTDILKIVAFIGPIFKNYFERLLHENATSKYSTGIKRPIKKFKNENLFLVRA